MFGMKLSQDLKSIPVLSFSYYGVTELNDFQWTYPTGFSLWLKPTICGPHSSLGHTNPPCPPNPPTLTYLVTWNRSGSPPDQNQPAHRYTINTLKGDISVKYILKRPYLHYTTSWKSSIYGSGSNSNTIEKLSKRALF